MEIDRLGLSTISPSIKQIAERISCTQSDLEKASPLRYLNQFRSRMEPCRVDLSRFNEIAKLASSVHAEFRSAREVFDSQFFGINHLRQSVSNSILPTIEAATKVREHFSKLAISAHIDPNLAEQLRELTRPFNLERTLTASFVDLTAISESVRQSIESLRLQEFDRVLFRRAHFQNLTERFATLAQTHNALWEEIPHSTIPSHEYFPAIMSRAPVELYHAATLLKSIGEIPTNHQSRQAEQVLDDASDKVEGKLAALDSRLVKPYRGAKVALESNNPDRARHFAVSIRELLTNVLHRLSPDSSFHDWNHDPTLVQNGKPTRKGRLLYICRFVNQGAFGRFLDSDLKATVEFINIFQQGTHSLEVTFSEKQLTAMMRRAEALISYLLEIGKADQ